jgi:hypothetical protein
MQCPTCRASNADDARWCTLCFDPFPVALAAAADVARPSPPPAGASRSGAFARTASMTLTRLVAGGPLFYIEPGGGAVAVIMTEHTGDGIREWADALLAGDSLRRLDERHTCLDLDDGVLFYVERYRAVPELAFTVFDPEGEPLGSYVSSDGLLEREVVVRDGTSAPVATMRAGADQRLDLFETGGEHIGFCWHEDCDLITVIDDRWGLVVLDTPSGLDRRAIVAAPLVCRLISRRRPRPKPRRREATSGWG